MANRQDQTLTYPDWLGTGYKRDIELPSGISLTFHQYRLKTDVINCCEPAPQDWVEFVFSLSTRYCYNGDQRFEPQQAYVAPPCRQVGHWQEFAEQDYLSIDIHLDRSLMNSLVAHTSESLPAPLAQVMTDDSPPVPVSPVGLTPAMDAALGQILRCPYQGITQTLYLEAKSIELIALFINAIQESPPLSAPLSRDDRDRIHHARQIILDSLQTPPSLIDLARQVGLNDRKLKAGFRQVFNTTVFGYLTQQRLEQASHLLAQQYSIAAVAAAVGYASPTAFSGAFRRRFGVTPKGYQMGQRFGA
ncbi:MAG: AraC family transcriptional regulator [Leptolyngbya sp. DLM2.Bin27]|nr:MAG: AraC family transcriptional regulator [Leptolyngbya sp. DLM2.Bin27]